MCKCVQFASREPMRVLKEVFGKQGIRGRPRTVTLRVHFVGAAGAHEDEIYVYRLRSRTAIQNRIYVHKPGRNYKANAMERVVFLIQ